MSKTSFLDAVLTMAPPDKPGSDQPRKARGKQGSDKKDTAFDMWLQRGLHQMFDDVTQEPVPDELLKLIEEDRKK